MSYNFTSNYILAIPTTYVYFKTQAPPQPGTYMLLVWWLMEGGGYTLIWLMIDWFTMCYVLCTMHLSLRLRNRVTLLYSISTMSAKQDSLYFWHLKPGTHIWKKPLCRVGWMDVKAVLRTAHNNQKIKGSFCNLAWGVNTNQTNGDHIFSNYFRWKNEKKKKRKKRKKLF